MGGERLQKVLARAGIASRRAAERLMAEGRVSVNGAVVREPGSRADAAADDIRVDGRPIPQTVPTRYLLLNKPRGFVTTRSDPQGRPTVMHLLPAQLASLYPVGRLDYDSEGLLLLTNDGELAARLLRPRHLVEREYLARVRGTPGAAVLARLARGIMIDGRRTAPAKVRVAGTGRGRRKDQTLLSIAVHEGRTHQVLKMCEAAGHPVVRLRRVRIGPLADRTLKSGAFRELSSQEVARLKRAAAVTAAARSPRT